MTKKPAHGETVLVRQGSQSFEGTVLPENKKGFLELKLKNGYNVSVPLTTKTKIQKMTTKKNTVPKKTVIEQKPGLPTILILHTGGTIASRVNYQTGGVYAAFSPEDLLQMFPELTQKANFETRIIGNMESENMRLSFYSTLAKAIHEGLNKKIKGIIISHGTDTMAYTAAALSFMVQHAPMPILLVGSQRSSDRGSSDASQNLSCAVDFILKSDYAGIGICMHASSNDDACWILPANKTRKFHTSRRDAFQAVNANPIATIEYKTGKIQMNEKNYARQGHGKPLLFKPKMEEKIGLLKATPTLLPEQIAFFGKQNFKGLIIEATGLGNLPILSRDSKDKTNDKNYKALQALLKKGCLVGIVSQCIYGSVQMNVYSAGRELVRIGMLNGKDMLAETALIKMAWLLGNYKPKEAAALFSENIVGEINERTLIENKAPTFEKE